jgi:hypothetical protein
MAGYRRAEAAAVNEMASGSQHRTMSAISQRIARSLSASARPQAMGSDRRGVEPDFGGISLDDGADRLRRQPHIADPVALAHGPEDRAGFDPGRVEPFLDGLCRAARAAADDGDRGADALLIGFRNGESSP